MTFYCNVLQAKKMQAKASLKVRNSISIDKPFWKRPSQTLHASSIVETTSATFQSKVLWLPTNPLPQVLKVFDTSVNITILLLKLYVFIIIWTLSFTLNIM